GFLNQGTRRTICGFGWPPSGVDDRLRDRSPRRKQQLLIFRVRGLTDQFDQRGLRAKPHTFTGTHMSTLFLLPGHDHLLRSFLTAHSMPVPSAATPPMRPAAARTAATAPGSRCPDKPPLPAPSGGSSGGNAANMASIDSNSGTPGCRSLITRRRASILLRSMSGLIHAGRTGANARIRAFSHRNPRSPMTV